MKLTDTIYIDNNGGLYLEYYASEGFYNYIHIDSMGRIEFLSKDIHQINGTKCDYYLDYCHSKALNAKDNIETLINNQKDEVCTYDVSDDIPF